MEYGRGFVYKPTQIKLTDSSQRNGPVVSLREMSSSQIEHITRKLGAKISKEGPPPTGKMLRRDNDEWVVVDFQLPFAEPAEKETLHSKRAKNGWQSAARVKRVKEILKYKV